MKTIYATAGIEFNFSKPYIQELMDFLADQLKKIAES
jgi:oligoendopeptidase F